MVPLPAGFGWTTGASRTPEPGLPQTRPPAILRFFGKGRDARSRTAPEPGSPSMESRKTNCSPKQPTWSGADPPFPKANLTRNSTDNRRAAGSHTSGTAVVVTSPLAGFPISFRHVPQPPAHWAQAAEAISMLTASYLPGSVQEDTQGAYPHKPGKQALSSSTRCGR